MTLVNQPTKQPTRKVKFGSTGAAAGAILAQIIIGMYPAFFAQEGMSAALTVVVAGVLGAAGSFGVGYMARERG